MSFTADSKAVDGFADGIVLFGKISFSCLGLFRGLEKAVEKPQRKYDGVGTDFAKVRLVFIGLSACRSCNKQDARRRFLGNLLFH